MVRAISLMAMAGMFLTISPNLRNTLVGGYNQAGMTMDAFSPYSYIALGIGALGFMMILVSGSAKPR